MWCSIAVCGPPISRSRWVFTDCMLMSKAENSLFKDSGTSVEVMAPQPNQQ